MKKYIRYILTFLILFVSVQVAANPWTLRNLMSSDGLKDLTVNSLYKDSLGFVWIGTFNSMERFDGVHLKHYAIPGGNQRLKYVESIAETEGHQIWMGNGMGLWRLNKQTDRFEQMVPDMINYGVYSLLNDGKGTLYIGSARGLYVYKGGHFKHRLLDPNAFSASNTIVDMALGEKNNLWIATAKGVYALDLTKDKLRYWRNEGKKETESTFRNIVCIGDKLYFGTMERGIICFDIPTETFSPYVSVDCNVVSSLSSDGKRMLYAGTDGNGVHFIDTERRMVVSSMRHEAGNNGSLRSNSVYSLLVDREGVVWVGFYQAGLDYTLYQGDTFSVYVYPPYFTSVDIPVRAVSISGTEKLIGSRDGLFYINETKNQFHLFNKPQMRSGMVFCISRFEGKYLVGTFGGGMYVIDPETLQMTDFSDMEPFQNGHIFCMEEDHTHTLWIGTSMGVYCYKEGKITAHYTSTNSKLPAGNVYEIFFDSTHKGWVCTENGLCIWEPSSKSMQNDVFPEGFIHKEKIRVVYEDVNHQLYFFPDKGALFLSDLTMNAFHRLQPDTPLEGVDGMFIIGDGKEGLWMGTSNGLYLYDRKENFVLYNFVDGIPSPMFTLCPPVRDEAGNFWFGNSKGLLFLDKKRIAERKKDAYPLRVTEVLVNGNQSLSLEDAQNQYVAEIALKSSERNITFRISDFSYTLPSVMSYEYQLEGMDDSWIPLLGKSEVDYYDLPSGSYLFRVRRMGRPDTEARLAVHVASGISWGMISGISLLVLMMGIGYYYVCRHKLFVVLHKPIQDLDGVPSVEEKSVVEVKYKTTNISAEECKRLVERLEQVMQLEKPYIHPDLKIADLAKAVGTSAYTLSYLFNQYLERNYYDYINDYRIAEFKRLVSTDEYSRYTLSALAELCGFSSRASFFRCFKKVTGITPNEYIRSIGKNHE